MVRPIISGFNPDPSICRGNDGYYMVTSSFEYYPGIAVYFSENLKDWSLVNYALRSEHKILSFDSVPDSCGIFAPTIRKYNNEYYIFCTFVNPNESIVDCNFYIKSSDPSTFWSDPVFLNFIGIDPSPLFTADGCYIQFSSRDEYNESCIKQILYNHTLDRVLQEEKIISYGSGGRDVEAPHLYEKDGYYYLLMAEGGTREGHMITMARSRDIWGPFVLCPHNPMLTHRNLANHNVQAVGHGDIVIDDKGDFHLFCLGTRPIKFKHIMGREVFHKSIIWPKDDWPYCGNYLTSEENIIETNQVFYENWIEVNELDISWRSIRKSIHDRIWFNEGLYLAGSQSYDKVNNPSFLSIQQKEYNFSLYLTVDTKKTIGLAGLLLENGSDIFLELLYMDSSKLYYNFNFYGIKNNIIIDVKKESEELDLVILGDEDLYRFGYMEDNEFVQINQIRTNLFSVEVSSSPFTGVTFGPFVKGLNSVGVFKKICINY